ncbi:MAG: nucleoside monophosphate kinase, partial [Candidatus Micrarchaeaceae archaeon]
MSYDLGQIKRWLGTGSINLFGRPFAGKDTQGRKLAELFNAPILGGGDILRGAGMPESIKAIMTSGELIPTKDYLELVLPYLHQSEFVGKPLILSSVGRWHGEEAGVLEATAAASHPLRAAIYLKASESTIRKRQLASQKLGDRGRRADDNKLQIRLEEFENKTLPVISFYRDEGLLIEVDANQPPD